MVTNVSSSVYYEQFPSCPHNFLRKEFIELNYYKVDNILFLMQTSGKPTIGLIGGLKDGIVLSHFSAPFGGFHYTHDNIYIGEMERYADDLTNYLKINKIDNISITFPPSYYGTTFNAKMINVLLRKGFSMSLPELTSWVNLCNFDNKYKQRNSREYYNQAVRNKLIFRKIEKPEDKKNAFDLICENRKRFARPLYMSFNDLLRTAELWPVDFFGIYDANNTILASAILYQFSNGIVFAVFWGDNELGRPLRAMDYLIFNLWTYYKTLGFIYVELGISTENGGIPNEGLLRFKETHEANTELRLILKWHLRN